MKNGNLAPALSAVFHWIFLVLLNFFYLDEDPKQCARYHGDKHLNKMQVEYAQILSLVWYRVVFDRVEEVAGMVNGTEGGEGVNGGEGEVYLILENLDDLKSGMYKRTKSHINHPVVKWASQSRAHYMAVAELGLALADEKRRRIEYMRSHLPVGMQKTWKSENASEKVLKFLHQHVPPALLFPKANLWSDPPKCMPDYYHNSLVSDDDGDDELEKGGRAFSAVESYRLFYAGHKVSIAHLSWEPYVETPDFIAPCQAYIQTRPDIQCGIEDDLYAMLQKKNTESSLGARKRQKL